MLPTGVCSETIVSLRNPHCICCKVFRFLLGCGSTPLVTLAHCLRKNPLCEEWFFSVRLDERDELTMNINQCTKHFFTMGLSAVVLVTWLATTSATAVAQEHHAVAQEDHAEEQHGEEAAHGDAISTSRPGLVRRPGVVGGGVFQIESGYTFAGATDETIHNLGEILLRIGVGARGEVLLELGSFVSEDSHGTKHSGLTDTRIGYKVLLADGGASHSGPVVSLSGGTSLPTGGQYFGGPSLQPFSDLGIHWSLADKVGLVTSLSFLNLDDGTQRYNEIIAATSLEFKLSDKAHGHIEYAFLSPFYDGSHVAHDVAGGVGFHINHDTALDIRTGFAKHYGLTEFILGVGFSRRW